MQLKSNNSNFLNIFCGHDNQFNEFLWLTARYMYLPRWPSGQDTQPPCAVERDALSGRGSCLSPGGSAYQRIISNNSYAHDEQPTRQLSLLPSAGREMSTGQSAVMLCGWGVRATTTLSFVYIISLLHISNCTWRSCYQPLFIYSINLGPDLQKNL